MNQHRKEQLRKEFETFLDAYKFHLNNDSDRGSIFEWFYKKIQERDETIAGLRDEVEYQKEMYKQLDRDVGREIDKYRQ